MAAFKKEIVAELADAPAQASDYIYVDNLRLVSKHGPCSTRSPPRYAVALCQVRPYYFDFKCFVKQRWEGLTLVELFSQVRASQPAQSAACWLTCRLAGAPASPPAIAGAQKTSTHNPR